MSDYDQLAIYNAEVARGIVHTPEWDQKMAAVQQRFNEQQAQQMALTFVECNCGCGALISKFRVRPVPPAGG